MILDDEQLLTEILEVRESGTYTNDPADPGGPTRWGITQETLAADRGRAVTPADVAALTEDEARSIYRRRYILAPGFGKIGDSLVRGLLIDTGILHGPETAVQFLQRAVGVADDGNLGPVTLAAYFRQGTAKTFDRVLAERIASDGRQITHQPVKATFAEGWANRIAGILRDRSY